MSRCDISPGHEILSKAKKSMAVSGMSHLSVVLLTLCGVVDVSGYVATRGTQTGSVSSPSVVRASVLRRAAGEGVRCFSRKQELDEQWRIQQEILARRRNKDKQKEYFENIKEKRQKLQNDFDSKRIKYKKGKDNLEQWKELNKGKSYKDEYSDEPGYSVPIPIASFGLPKFDNGERFDLRLPYVDNGYVAEDSDDVVGRFLEIFGVKKKEASKEKSEPEPKGKAPTQGKATTKGAPEAPPPSRQEPFNPFGRFFGDK
ncbi:hypothetical protein AAMO2058_000292400 [Amorphochlora amoebiformis]